MLITEQSLAETLDGRAGDPRRRCRLFIPHQAVFIPNQLLFSPRLVCRHPADRWPGEAGHPAAGVKGITGEWSSNPSPRVRPCWPPASPAVLTPGFFDVYARARKSLRSRYGAVPANCIATGGLADGAAPAQAVGTDN